MAHARLSSKGQVVIPREIRDALRLRTGDDLEFILHDGHAHVQKAGDPLEAFLAGPRVRWGKGELDRLLGERFG